VTKDLPNAPAPWADTGSFLASAVPRVDPFGLVVILEGMRP